MFVDRELIQHSLRTANNVDRITEILIDGESGVGKTALLKYIYNKDTLYIDNQSSDYFKSICFRCVEFGFHDYLLSLLNCNYKDIFYARNNSAYLDAETTADFILANKFILDGHSLNIEQQIAKFLLKKSISVLILDNFEFCKIDSYAKILNIIKSLFYESISNKFIVFYAIDSNIHSDVYYTLSKRIPSIRLGGLNSRYLQAIIRELFQDPNYECDELADYFFCNYQGNPGAIINIFKSNLDLCQANSLTQSEILRKIIHPNFNKLEFTEKLILLYVSIKKEIVPKSSILLFLKYSTQGIICDIDEILEELSENELITVHCGKIYASNLVKKIFRNFALGNIALVNIIYNYQINKNKELSNVENADLMQFVIDSTIHLDSDYENSYMEYALKSAEHFFFQENYLVSTLYYDALLPYVTKFGVRECTNMLQAFYYNAQYEKADETLRRIEDKNYTDYGYWYWKGNILYMLNNPEGIGCFLKAIRFANNIDDKLNALNMYKEAISESPTYCINTHKVYKSILKKYKDYHCRALAILYRNSLVLGGNEACNIGLTIAREFHMEEEEIKLQHNKHFELFRMGKYDGCENAFGSSANYFQENSKRIYESAYGFNNLALLCMVYDDYERARLYAYSATIYAGTPYSMIATKVNANLINSFVQDDDFDIEKAVDEVENLIKKFNIQDKRIYRKTYFSSAIAFINRNIKDKAIEYIRKSEKYLDNGKHINRYYNLCKLLNIKPKMTPDTFITKTEGYYNFYANPKFDLWLLAYGHI